MRVTTQLVTCLIFLCKQLQIANAAINFRCDHLMHSTISRRRMSVTPVQLTATAGKFMGSSGTEISSKRGQDNFQTDEEIKIENQSKFWPPWPFNLLVSRSNTSEVSKISLLSEYLRQRAIFCLYGIQTVTSEASLHLPPAAPSLILLAVAPNAKFTKKIVFGSLGLALLSWGQDELSRVRRTRNGLVDCNLYHKDQVLFPPFLPEDEEENNELLSLTDYDDELSKKGNSTWVMMQMKLNSLKRQRIIQQRERIMLELQALKEIKKTSNAKNSFALVTGASQGLGRAISVELARRNINLILVARDIDKLTKLATDLTNFYGVKCHTIQADLSEADTPQRVFNATTNFGLNVDVLINNAGLSTTTEFVDESSDHLNDVLNVNVISTMRLSHLYLRNMRNRRKGAIMFVSSIVGHMPGCPSATVYAATKSFERSLALGLSKESEKYGIAVTLLSPGAISGTNFAERGEFTDALCWKIPFYPKSPEFVAKVGVDALSDGKLECIPGWQNRFGIRILQPMLPQKFMLGIGQMAWQPLKKSLPVWLGGEMVETVLSPELEYQDPNEKLKSPKIPMQIELPSAFPQQSTPEVDATERTSPRTNATIDSENEHMIPYMIDDNSIFE